MAAVVRDQSIIATRFNQYNHEELPHNINMRSSITIATTSYFINHNQYYNQVFHFSSHSSGDSVQLPSRKSQVQTLAPGVSLWQKYLTFLFQEKLPVITLNCVI